MGGETVGESETLWGMQGACKVCSLQWTKRTKSRRRKVEEVLATGLEMKKVM